MSIITILTILAFVGLIASQILIIRIKLKYYKSEHEIVKEQLKFNEKISRENKGKNYILESGANNLQKRLDNIESAQDKIGKDIDKIRKSIDILKDGKT